MSKKDKNQSRRDFLDKGLIAGAGLAIGMSALANKKESQSGPIRMITLDGKLVEVQPEHIYKRCAGKVSNKTLLKWMKEEKEKSKS